jgi:hypothetical protein
MIKDQLLILLQIKLDVEEARVNEFISNIPVFGKDYNEITIQVIERKNNFELEANKSIDRLNYLQSKLDYLKNNEFIKEIFVESFNLDIGDFKASLKKDEKDLKQMCLIESDLSENDYKKFTLLLRTVQKYKAQLIIAMETLNQINQLIAVTENE